MLLYYCFHIVLFNLCRLVYGYMNKEAIILSNSRGFLTFSYINLSYNLFEITNMPASDVAGTLLCHKYG